jgi:hypothetical protein
MTRFLTRGRFHRAPLKRRKLSHVLSLSADASQVHTQYCEVISGVVQA